MVYLEQRGDVLGLVGSFIVAGDSANSGFIKILDQSMPVGSMGPTVMPPPPAAKMSAENIALIARWIDEGAKDN